MGNTEGRTAQPHSTRAQRSDMNDAQLESLADLKRSGWQLKFVRRPIFEPSIPVVFDADRKTYAIVEADGGLNQHRPFEIRGD